MIAEIFVRTPVKLIGLNFVEKFAWPPPAWGTG